MKGFWFVTNTIGLHTMLCIFSLSCFANPLYDNTSSTNQKLKGVKSDISEAKSALKEVNQKRTVLENQLKESDLSISQVTQKITNNKNNKKIIQNKLVELNQAKNKLITNKKRQESLLAKQLQAAYSTGHHDYIKLLLNQKNPTTIQRTITHYQYLNNARISEINNFKDTITELLAVEKKHKVQSFALNKVTLALENNKALLEKNKQKRTTTLALIKKEQLSKQQQLDKLISEEKSLKNTLKKLKLIVKTNKNLNGLATLKRKLKWPVSGRIAHNFGTQKQGYLKWKGVLTRAKLGQNVRSVYRGKVLFSNWLKGYGLVTIIDHGKGYMSLYGYNQTLLKKVGDYVEQGEAIALVGQSGGQSQPGLYFEIRHAGQAKNPKLWCR